MFDAEPTGITPLMQDPTFAAALALCGGHIQRLPNGLMLLRRRIAGLSVSMLPRACPPPDLAAQLRAIGRHRHPLVLSPETPCPLPRSLPLWGPRARAVLDLQGGNETCRSRLHPKWRNQLNAVQKRPVSVIAEHLEANPDHVVLNQETLQARARGYTCWPAALTAAFAAIAPHQTHLMRATYLGETVAHMLFLSHGTGATYHIGHITTEGKQLAAHNLLLWSAARRLASLGCLQLDLGPIDPRTPGLNRFKLRTGAQVKTTGGTHLYWRPFAA